jgi:methylated-DNA-[protein]-cysteine S-methyltransferase
MIKYTTFQTAFGHVTITATERGLARVSMTAAGRKPMHEDWVEDRRALASIANQLKAYFAGKPVNFHIDLDLSEVTPFQRRVLEACAQIPYGQVTTYGELARRIGRPKAARAVGHAMARNPIPIVIPCHRVIASDGSMCGFSAEQGIALKRRLLEMEYDARKVKPRFIA